MMLSQNGIVEPFPLGLSTEVPPRKYQSVRLHMSDHGTQISLANCYLVPVPGLLGDLTDRTELDLSGNRLTPMKPSRSRRVGQAERRSSNDDLPRFTSASSPASR